MKQLYKALFMITLVFFFFDSAAANASLETVTI